MSAYADGFNVSPAELNVQVNAVFRDFDIEERVVPGKCSDFNGKEHYCEFRIFGLSVTAVGEIQSKTTRAILLEGRPAQLNKQMEAAFGALSIAYDPQAPKEVRYRNTTGLVNETFDRGQASAASSEAVYLGKLESGRATLTLMRKDR
ncbi:hypothetical protein [Microvirga sp. TS319]|uniref:hypothetical protein n=1 Tax=Microvirga sp. TS319 TaxID=3241165 RepID=UPI00351AA59A